MLYYIVYGTYHGLPSKRYREARPAYSQATQNDAEQVGNGADYQSCQRQVAGNVSASRRRHSRFPQSGGDPERLWRRQPTRGAVKLLDSNTVIQYVKGHEGVIAKVKRELEIAVPSIVVYEIEVGTIQ